MILFKKINSLDARKISLLIGALQGVLLFIMFELRSFEMYTSVYFALLTALLITPTTILLTLEEDSIDSVLYWVTIGLSSVLIVSLAFYFGLKQDDAVYRSWNFNASSFFVTFLIAWFIFLLFFQSCLQEKRLVPSYQSQFDNSWNNFLTVVLSSLFLSLLWGGLFLWATLFKALGVDLFLRLFSLSWFYIPVTTIALAYFINLLKSQVDAVGIIRRILTSLFQFLLPLTLFMAVLFAATLVFGGIDVLWEGRRALGTSTLLLTSSVALFLFNAVYQSADESPYSARLNKVIRYSLGIFVVYMVFAWYGLSSRVSQYGLTVNLAHAAIVAATLSCYTLSYSASNFLSRSRWQYFFRKTNSLIAVIVGVICILLNTPLMNLEKITVNQHVQGYTTGLIDSSEIDVYYLARKTGHYGQMALETLKKSDGYADQIELQDNIEQVKTRHWSWNYESRYAKSITDQASRKKLRIVPLNAKVPEAIFAYLANNLKSKGCYKELTCSLIVQDLNSDDIPEYMFIDSSGGFGTKAFMLTIQHQDKSQAAKIDKYRVNFSSNMSGLCCLRREFDAGVKVTAKAPTWHDLAVGEKRFMVDSHIERKPM